MTLINYLKKVSEFVIAETQYGKVSGIKKTSLINIPYVAFLGIPFATPPVGKLRFKDPIPPSPWENIYDASFEKSNSFSESFYLKKIVGSEDCLYLNIFTKNLNPDKLQPVLFYIHGGGFYSGSGSTELLGPDFLLMADVVVVTINYRLGALGFLNLKDKELNVPGNAGLKDQLLAMKFVKSNIRNFGGDPNNITIFGQSSGGSSVSWHCVSERSKGLFQKAIIMAGCVLNSWSLTPHRDWAYRLAIKLGYEGSENEREILNFLENADPIRIVQVQDNLKYPEDKGKVELIFAPHIEHYTTDETFISEYPIDLVRKAWSNDIDIFIGGTSNEGLMYLEYIKKSPQLLKSLKLEKQIPSELNLNDDDPTRHKFAERLKELYYPLTDPTEDQEGFFKLVADKGLWHGMQRNIQSRRNSGRNGKTYLYRFDVDSPTQNHYRIARLGPEVRGVCHADEVSYLFKNIYTNVPPRNSMEFTAIQRFVSLFTSFATTGNPNDNIINADMENVIWDPVDFYSLEPPFKCLNIGEHLTFENLPESERLTVWDAMYKETNTPLY